MNVNAPTDFPAELLIAAAKPEKLTTKSESSCDTEYQYESPHDFADKSPSFV
jgi:hypothetical protein